MKSTISTDCTSGREKAKSQRLKRTILALRSQAPFCGDDDLATVVALAQDFSKQLLVVRIGTVDRRSVPEVDTLHSRSKAISYHTLRSEAVACQKDVPS